MVGILIQGNNQLILSGPLPDALAALALAALVHGPNWRGEVVVFRMEVNRECPRAINWEPVGTLPPWRPFLFG